MKTGNLVSLILAVLICVAFFLPWVSVESQLTGRISQVLTGKSQAALVSLSGFDIPVLANSSDARLVVSIIKVFNPNVTNIDKKSWLVWVVPVLAIIIFLIGLFMMQNRWFNLTLAVIGIAIFSAGLYQIAAADLDKVVLNAKIETGVWLFLWSYLGLGLLGAVNFIRRLVYKKARKG